MTLDLVYPTLSSCFICRGILLPSKIFMKLMHQPAVLFVAEACHVGQVRVNAPWKVFTSSLVALDRYLLRTHLAKLILNLSQLTFIWNSLVNAGETYSKKHQILLWLNRFNSSWLKDLDSNGPLSSEPICNDSCNNFA